MTGADQIARAAKALKTQGPSGAAGRKELLKAIQTETKQVRKDMQLSAFGELPKHGGLNSAVARSTFSTRTRAGTTARGAGVRIVITGKKVRDIVAIDRGRLRHPVFGNRKVWVQQAIKPGVFTDEFERAAPALREAITKAMVQIVRNITRSSK